MPWKAQLSVVVLSTLLGSLTTALAEEAAPFMPPPPPSRSPPWWELEIGGAVLAPLERTAVCPAGRECVLNGGVGLGVRATYRTPDRVGWTIAYDVGALDSASLYEIALLHAVRGELRYVIDDESRIGPWLSGGIGGLLFGDASNVSTGGFVISAGGGVHAELTSNFALVASAHVWLLGTAPFSTRDGIARGDPFGVSVVGQILLGALVRIGSLAR